MIGLGPHVMAGPGSLIDFLAATKPAVIKYVDPSDHPILAPLTVGRIFEISDQKNLSNPKGLAGSHADAISKRADATGIKIWEGINEMYQIWEDTELCKRFQDYELERMRILHTRGLNVAVLCINTGWPKELPDHTIDWSGVDTLMRSLGPNDLVDIHEYFRKDGPRGSAYLSEAGRFFRCPYRNVKFFTSECGIDIGGGQNDGFLGQGVTPVQYANMLIEFRNICATDSRWVGGTPFTFGHFAGGQWEKFDWEPYWQEFISAMTPIATITDTIRILQTDGTVKVLEIEEYLRGVLPAEMYPDWPQEALMAGAIAARSYAMAHRTLNKPDWDVDTTTSTQVYDPRRIHPNTDKAILATKSLHLIKNSKIYMSEYKALCGRTVDCLYCKSLPLPPIKQWPNQMCQYGAWQMAKDGKNFREILHHYYSDVRISDEAITVPPIVIPPVVVPPVIIPPVIVPTSLSNYLGYGKPKIGLHWTPSPYHAHANLTWVLDKCKQMNLGWITLLDDGGGSSLQPSVFYGGKSIIDMLLERNIIPVVRIFAPVNAKFDSRMEDTTKRLVERSVKYIFFLNEPEVGATEWGEHGKPKDWVKVVTRSSVDFAYKAMKLGAYPGLWATTTHMFPDENGNIINPLLVYMTQQERDDIFKNGLGWWPIHNYPKNHPVDYPYDAVNLHCAKMQHDEYLWRLNEVDETYRKTQHLWVFDDYQVDKSHINFVRNLYNPNATIDTDNTCFRMYQGMNRILHEADLMEYVPLISTEIGPCTGERDDGRYARVTPQEQIRMISAMDREIKNVPNYFGMCFWLAGCQRLNTITADSFEDQGWWTDRHNEPFNLQGELPIVQYLIDKNNNTPEPEPPPIVIIPGGNDMPTVINDAEAYGITIRPYPATLGEQYWKIIQVHHYMPTENDGRHNLYFDVLDEQKNRVNGARVIVIYNSGRTTYATIDKSANEPGSNIPLFSGDVVSAEIKDAKSDLVQGIHTQHPDEPPVTEWGHTGNAVGHHSFLVVWKRITKQNETPVAGTPTDKEVQETTWNKLKIPYNEVAAFQSYAREHDMGCPMTLEYDLGDTRCQGFMTGIIRCPIGQWDKISHISW